LETNLNRFYVYTHTRLDKNTIFYVGKGSGNRAFSRKRKNKHWHAVAENGWVAKIYKTGLTEQCAFCIEKMLIASIGLKNLTNFTIGGEGVSGYSPSLEQREKASKLKKGKPMPAACVSPEAIEKRRLTMKGRKQTKEHKEKVSVALKGKSKGGKIYDFYHPTHGFVTTTIGLMHSKYGHNRNMDALVKQRIRSTKGWSLAKNKDDVGHRVGDMHHNIDKKIYTFIHKEYGIEKCKRHELSKKYKIPVSRVGQVARKEKPSCNGWRLMEE
jgi:hypothetical protein